MARVTADISLSLDGFITGPNDGPDNPLGDEGQQLHQWVYGLRSWRERHQLSGGDTGPDADLLSETFAETGAVLMGRRMFEAGEGPWGDDPPFRVPVFVVTHTPREPLTKSGTTFTFVTEGVESALAQARTAAEGRDVSVAGGARMIQQALVLGLLDELQLHLVPVLLGGGIRLFDHLGPQPPALEKTRVVDSAGVTHLRLRPVR